MTPISWSIQCSQLGAVIREEHDPIHIDVPCDLSYEKRLDHALHDGVDFGLQCAVLAENRARLWGRRVLELPLWHIGDVTADASECRWRSPDGRSIPLRAQGCQHQL